MSRIQSFPPRVADITDLAAMLEPGERIYMPGSTGEVPSFTRALCREGAPPLDVTTSFVPGINASPVDHLTDGTTYTSMFMLPGPREGQASGKVRHLPLSYAGFVKNLEQMSFDTCVVHVSPPDAHGRCSLGTAVEFTPIAMRRSRRVFAVINPQMPYIPSANSIRLADVEAWVESDAPLSEYDVGVPTYEAKAIAATIADYIPDGAAIQIGLGKVPDALLRHLTERRKLRLFSGMLSNGARSLLESGSLDSDFAHTCCVHVGTRSYYEWLQGTSFFRVRGCDVTHSIANLSSLDGLVAVNSAVSVDLFGQANLEMIAGRGVSGLGGAPDFARGAVAAKGGISIIALPSTSGKAALSRVVPLIDGVCSLPRCDIDIIVTEHGAADLRNCSALERGKRIIQVAAPQHRAALAETFHEMVRKF